MNNETMKLSELQWGKDIESHDAIPIPNSDAYRSIIFKDDLHRYITQFGDMEVNVREGNIWFKFDIPEINEGRELATERKAETLKKWGYPD